jgi:hypothetical protein
MFHKNYNSQTNTPTPPPAPQPAPKKGWPHQGSSVVSTAVLLAFAIFLIAFSGLLTDVGNAAGNDQLTRPTQKQQAGAVLRSWAHNLRDANTPKLPQ